MAGHPSVKCNALMQKAELTNIGCTNGWTPIHVVKPSDSVGGCNQVRLHLSLVQASDPLGRAYKDTLHLMWHSHKCIVPK